MIIDGHAHACGDLLSPEGILRTLEANGVDKIILVPGEHESAKTYGLPNLARMFPTWEVANVTNAMTRMVVRSSGAAKHLEEDNETVFRFSRSHPDRILQFYWITLRDGFDASNMDARHRSWHFKGLKLHQCWDEFEIGSEAFVSAADFAAANDLPIFIHLVSRAQATALRDFASRHPDSTFIVGHLYCLECFIGAGRSVQNVYFDVSCPDIVSDVRLNKAITHFGPGRIILGSDTPYGRDGLSRSIRRIRSLDIPGDDKDLILGGNMARLLGLRADEERVSGKPKL